MAALRKQGHTVHWSEIPDQTALPGLRRPAPDLFLIDLTRAPSRGRDVALWLRRTRSTRAVPLLFAGGEAEKVRAVRKSVPDAAYAPWSRIRSAIREAIRRAPGQPAVPESTLAGYSGTPLPRKLGIKPGMIVTLVSAPAGFPATLGPLPEGARLRRRATGASGLVLWFVRSRAALESDLKRVSALMEPGGGMWIAWPKQSSGVKTDVTQNDVRRLGLASGLVDYKICAIDSTWSGLKFARRKRS